MKTRTPVEILRDMIGLNERTIADLEARHGTGVRSAWVGEEIGIHHYRIEHLKRQLLEVGDTQ